MSKPDVEWTILEQLQDGGTITPADFLIEVRRIADALEAANGKPGCDGVKNGKACVLDPDHVGHHASRDGRLHWLDEE